jgi:pyruvate formate lyase activating enzyme
MDRRRFIGCGFAGAGMAVMVPSICCNEENRISSTDNIDKYTREALFYQITPRGARCELCPNKCTVTEIRRGDCKTRVFEDGKLLTQAYGNPYFVKTERPEERSLYHFYPGADLMSLGTAGCTLQCLYCSVYEVSQKSPAEVPHKQFFPADVIAGCKKNNIPLVAFTYTEPVAYYEYMIDTATLAKQQGIKTIITSNGYILAEPLKKLIPLLNAAVIEVKAFSDNTYLKMTAGNIAPVFETLKMIRESHVWLEIYHLLVPGWTNNWDLLEKMGKWLVDNGFKETPFHIDRFLPKYRLSQLNPTSYDDMVKAREVLLKAGVHYVYATYPDYPSGLSTICPNCHSAVITRSNSHVLTKPRKPGICNACGNRIAGVWEDEAVSKE